MLLSKFDSWILTIDSLVAQFGNYRTTIEKHLSSLPPTEERSRKNFQLGGWAETVQTIMEVVQGITKEVNDDPANTEDNRVIRLEALARSLATTVNDAHAMALALTKWA